MKKLLKLLPLFILTITSCALKNNATVILWTDKPEMAAYIEEFNSIQGEYQIELVYKKEPGKSLENEENPGDIIISEFLNSPELIKLFSPLTNRVAEGIIDPTIFYSGLLDPGYIDEELFLLPISFNLPTIMLKKEQNIKDIPAFYLNPDKMKETALKFNNKSKANFEVMGFSPRWDSKVLYLNAVLMKTNFHVLKSGILSWNEKNLKDSLQMSKTWNNEINGSLKLEEDFKAKFLYDPAYKLIEKNRILFYYSDLVNFFRISPEKRDDLEFRWLSLEDRIPVLGNVLFLGMPDKANNSKGATQFIHWFFNYNTQKNLLKSSQIKRLDTFGFANGFSSIKDINEKELPIMYPKLVGYIPQESSLIFPKALPPFWNELKTKVIEPWMFEQTGANPPDTSLQDAINEWLKQRS